MHDSCRLTERFLSTGTSLTTLWKLEEEVAKVVQQNAGDLMRWLGNVRFNSWTPEGAMDTMMLAYSSHQDSAGAGRRTVSWRLKIALDCAEIQDTVVYKDKVHTALQNQGYQRDQGRQGRKIEVYQEICFRV